MAFQWRRFTFFDKELLADGPTDSVGSSSSNSTAGATRSQLFNDGFIPVCSTSGRGHVFFGDAKGWIKVMNRDLEESRFQAYESGVLHMQQLKKSNLLVTVGNDGGGTSIKIWRIQEGETQQPQMARALKVFSPKFPAVPVTSFSVLEDLSQLAIGLGNGAVMLFDGNLLRDRHPSQSLILPPGSTVVAVHFRETDTSTPSSSAATTTTGERPTPSSSSKHLAPVSLFVVTTTSVLSIFTKTPSSSSLSSLAGALVSPSSHRYAMLELDSFPAGVGCSELAGTCLTDEKRLVVTTKDAVFFYEADEKREAYGFEGEKKIAKWFNNYLVIVSENRTLDAMAATTEKDTSATRKAVSPSTTATSPSAVAVPLTTDTLTIYDLRHKFLALVLKTDSLSLVTSEYNSLFLVTHTSKFLQLTEHDLQSKMDALFKKNLYQIAISLATHSTKDKTYVMDIYQRYGDHLLSKGDYDGAVAQYIETIRYVEPSYVIRKFLDAARIHNLTRYLQALHEQGRANKEHTTLLLNCWTKLKDVKKLDEFVKGETAKGASASSSSPAATTTAVNELNFDVPTAISVCRSAGYYDHALYLAQRHGQHTAYLSILLEDTSDVAKAIEYISTLPFTAAYYFTRLHGAKMMHALPLETTKLIQRLCLGWTAADKGDGKEDEHGATSPVAAAQIRANPGDFLHLFLLHPSELEQLLECFFLPQHQHVLQGWNTLWTAPQTSPASAAAAIKSPLSLSSTAAATGVYTLPPLDTKDATKNPQIIVCNTLLELYLRQYATMRDATAKVAASDAAISSSSSAAAASDKPDASVDEKTNPYYSKTYQLLKIGYGRYDSDLALLLCKSHGFEKGVVFLYEKLKLWHELLAYHIGCDNVNGVIATCQRHGDKAPQLWTQALTFLAKQKQPKEEQTQIVLQAIKERSLMPPLMILQLLSQNPAQTLSVVKPLLLQTLQQENDLIHADQEEIARYTQETKQMREEINRLHTQPITFQGFKCHQCTANLNLPAVHFLCMHSFHQRCVVDSEQECPKCAQQYRQVRGIRESMKSAATQHDRFFKRLEEEKDGFSVVAEFFSRGIIAGPYEKQKAAAAAAAASAPPAK